MMMGATFNFTPANLKTDSRDFRKSLTKKRLKNVCFNNLFQHAKRRRTFKVHILLLWNEISYMYTYIIHYVCNDEKDRLGAQIKWNCWACCDLFPTKSNSVRNFPFNFLERIPGKYRQTFRLAGVQSLHHTLKEWCNCLIILHFPLHGRNFV